MEKTIDKSNKPNRALVAERAGVSIATVSCVLNNTRTFSPETREKVLAAVKELKYVPDMAARSMKTNQSYQFAVIINDISNPMFLQLVSELEKQGIKHNYFLNICGGYADFEVYVNQLIARRIDGVFLAVKLNKLDSKLLDKLVDNGVRIVSGGGKDYNNYRTDVTYVNIDMKGGLDSHFRLLKSLGHKKAAYLSAFPADDMDDGRVRLFCELSEKYFGEKKPFVFSKDTFFDTNIENGYRMGQEMLQRLDGYTAVIATNDLMAMGFIKAMRDNGLHCPEDISVLGIDNNALSAVFEPSITTFGPDYTEYAKAIFDLLFEKNADSGEHTVGIKHYVRESTGVARQRSK